MRQCAVTRLCLAPELLRALVKVAVQAKQAVGWQVIEQGSSLFKKQRQIPFDTAGSDAFAAEAAGPLPH